MKDSYKVQVPSLNLESLPFIVCRCILDLVYEFCIGECDGQSKCEMRRTFVLSYILHNAKIVIKAKLLPVLQN